MSECLTSAMEKQKKTNEKREGFKRDVNQQQNNNEVSSLFITYYSFVTFEIDYYL